MRPDRLIVGEVRGAEICDLLLALNTGHEGGCGTVHANSVAAIPTRLTALAALGGLDREAAQSQMLAALDAVIHLVRDDKGRRRVAEIGILQESESGKVVAVSALAWDGSGKTHCGPGYEMLAAQCMF